MRAKFVILNIMFACIVGVLWHLGILDGIKYLAFPEIIMCSMLFIYSLIGFVAALRGNFDTVGFIAHGVPIWALSFTVLGLLLAASQLTNTAPETMLAVFKGCVFAITPNMVGVVLMAWLREIAKWCGDEIV